MAPLLLSLRISIGTLKSEAALAGLIFRVAATHARYCTVNVKLVDKVLWVPDAGSVATILPTVTV